MLQPLGAVTLLLLQHHAYTHQCKTGAAAVLPVCNWLVETVRMSGQPTINEGGWGCNG